ncbi:MAG: adenylate cyclase regulatory domain-containing protein, partial [Solirubrobacteraceae bacterium]
MMTRRYVGDVADIEELLDGLEGPARAERAELIEWLLGQGITVETIRDAFAPMLLVSRRLMGDDGSYVSAREISEGYGIDLELLQRVQRAIGLARVDDPDAAVHMRADGVAAAHTQRFVELGLDPDQVVLVVRVLAEGLAHAAEVMRYSAMAAILQPGATELQIAEGSQALVSRVKPLLGPMIEDMLLMHLRHAMETEEVNASERAAGKPLPGARQVTVAFADLVGFTRLGEEVPPEELGQLANRLADLARDVAVPPVRFIKTIGDAVMFVCTDPAPLLDVVLKLVEATDTDNDFPRLRAGIASGMAVSRAGDWFGSPVNVASRVTGAARPGAVLV